MWSLSLKQQKIETFFIEPLMDEGFYVRGKLTMLTALIRIFNRLNEWQLKPSWDSLAVPPVDNASTQRSI